jgi:hypothetical protein
MKLKQRIRTAVRQGNFYDAIVIDVNRDHASARLSKSGILYKNLLVMGGPVVVGQTVKIDLAPYIPYILASGESQTSQESKTVRYASIPSNYKSTNYHQTSYWNIDDNGIDYTDGHVGIGDESSSGALLLADYDAVGASIADFISSGDFRLYYDMSKNNNSMGHLQNFYAYTNVWGSGSTTETYGIKNYVYYDADGYIGTLVGEDISVLDSGSGPTVLAKGINVYMDISSPTVYNVYGVNLDISFTGSGGTFYNDLYGLCIDVKNNSSMNIPNRYGIYLKKPVDGAGAITSKDYAIYVEAGWNVYFGGDVSFGGSANASTLSGLTWSDIILLSEVFS